jgi:hypothetical protein
MDAARLSELLENVRSGKLSVIQAMARLRQLPFEDLVFAKVDHHRDVRQGCPEVILGQGKEAKQIAAIVRVMQRNGSNVLVTRLEADKMARVKKFARGLKYHAAHQHRLRCQLSWRCGAARDAQLMRGGRDGGKHRQWLWRRVCGEPNKPVIRAACGNGTSPAIDPLAKVFKGALVSARHGHRVVTPTRRTHLPISEVARACGKLFVSIVTIRRY